MPECMLSLSMVASLRSAVPTRPVVYRDTDLPGFSLTLLPSGEGTWRYGAPGGRRTVLGPLSALDAAEARRMAYAASEGPEAGVPAAPETFREFVSGRYAAHARTSKRSWAVERRIIKACLLPSFGDARMDRVDGAAVRLWLEETASRVAPATANRRLSVLRAVFRRAVEWGALSWSPCVSVRDLPPGPLRTRFLSRDELSRLLAALGDCLPHLAIRLLAHTGARKSEVLGARWEDVDVERRVLTVPLSKHGGSRAIPLSDAALEVVAAIPRTGSPWLFPGRRPGTHLVSLTRPWSALRASLGLQGVRLHDLRHTFASLMANDGRSLYEIGRVLGHRDLRSTERYAHLADGTLLDAVNGVAAALAGKPSGRESLEGLLRLLESRTETILLLVRALREEGRAVVPSVPS